MKTPKKRDKDLLLQQIDEELVVYDQQKKRAHRLNKTNTAVWQLCDGTRTVSEITAILKKELNDAADENLVLLALSQLDDAHLLQEPMNLSTQQTRTSRREFVRKVGAVGVASLLLPLITTMAAPKPAQAQSGLCALCTGCSFCLSCTICGNCSGCSCPCAPCTTCFSCTICGNCSLCACC